MSAQTQLAITGDLTMGKVADAMTRIGKMPNASDVVIDFALIKETDSSAVALLINALRIGRERGSTVRFASVPESVLTLAEIYGLRSVIADAIQRP